MARQGKLFQLEGTIGDLCFYKTKHGYFVRRKRSVSRARMKSHPAYAVVRKNNEEFGRAAHAVKLFRMAFAPLLRRAADSGISARLMHTMMKVIKADVVNERGQRTVKDGQPQLLEGFEFNQDSQLSNILHTPLTASIDGAEGVMTIDVKAFSAEKMLSAPEGATHFRLFSAGAAIDFEDNTLERAMSESAYLPIKGKRIGPFQLTQKIKPRSPGQLFLLVGVEFVQVVNGERMPLKDKGFNALAVVRVAG